MYKRRRKSLSLLVQMGYVTSVTWQNRKMDFAPFAWIKVSFFFRRRTIWKDFWRTRKCNQSIRRTRGKAIKVSNADLERQSKHPKDKQKGNQDIQVTRGKSIKMPDAHALRQSRYLTCKNEGNQDVWCTHSSERQSKYPVHTGKGNHDIRSAGQWISSRAVVRWRMS